MNGLEILLPLGLTFLGSIQSLHHLYERTPVSSILFSVARSSLDRLGQKEEESLSFLSPDSAIFLKLSVLRSVKQEKLRSDLISRGLRRLELGFPSSFFKTMRSVHRDHHRHHHPSLHLHLPHIHLHHHHHGREEEDNLKDVPRGCLAISVGQGEEQRRFVIPVAYVNHPLFADLLREAEDEYGFDQKGPINIPCHVDEFRIVQDSIDRDVSRSHRHDHHDNNIQGWCFGTA